MKTEMYLKGYHKLFSEFISNTDFAALIDSTAALIAEYVEKDPTKFCTYEEYEKGVAALREFCQLRVESIKGQLDGSIPSTSSGQSADSSSPIDTSSLNISDMGNMSGGFGGFGGDRGNNRFGNFNRFDENNDSREQETPVNTGETTRQQFGGNNHGIFGNNMQGNSRGELPEGFDPSAMAGGNNQGGFGNNTQDNSNGEFPEGFDPSTMTGGNNQGGFGNNMQGGLGGNRFGKEHHISSSTINRLKHNKPVSIATIEKLCEVLNCDVYDIMEFKSDKKN